MPFSLKEYNLKPNSTYRVSLVLNQGDKEIDSLRSFYSKTPIFFTKNLPDLTCYPFSRTGTKPTAAKPDVTTGGTVVSLKVDKLSWKIKGSLKSGTTPKYNFTLTFKKINKKTVNFSAQQLAIDISSGNAWMQRALQQMVIGAARSAKNGKIYFTVDAATMGLTRTGSAGSYNWNSDSVAPRTNGSYTPKKSFPKIKYTTGATTVPGTPAYFATSKYIEASVDNSIYSELINTDTIKDVIVWLFSDNQNDAPTSITQGDWKFLDITSGNNAFVAGQGGLLTAIRATGQSIYLSTSYYLPTYADLKTIIDSNKKNNGILQKMEVFSDSNLNAGTGVTLSDQKIPTNFYICFTIVRFTLINNAWTSQWLVQEPNSAFPTPQISQIMSAGAA
jgi:hypothetical protein